MPCSFSYSGTSPATVVNFAYNPLMGDWEKNKKWLSPRVAAAGEEDVFVKNKSVTLNFHTLTWKKLIDADRTSLLAFITAVNGIGEEFSYTDPAGDGWRVRIWNAGEIRESLIAYHRTEITIELLLLSSAGKTLYDSIAMSDVFSRVVPFVRSASDAISLSDIFLFKFNGAWILNPPPADNVSLSDLRATSVTPAVKSESIALSDSMHARFGLFGYLTDESGNYITDESGNYIIVGTGQWIKAAQDTIAMSDAMSYVNTSPRYLTDESGNYITDESGNRIRADEITTG